MADLSGVDLVGLIQRMSHVDLPIEAGTGVKRTKKGTCPWCGGKKRFVVFINETPQRYYCGIHNADGCRRRGDAVTFLRHWPDEDTMTYFEACDELGVDPGSQYVRVDRGTQYHDMLVTRPPCKKWQERANIIIFEAQKVLWGTTSDASLVLEYLHRRGLTDETIRDAHLGYIPFSPNGKERWFCETLEQWGLSADEVKPDEEEPKVWLPEGLLIPWFEGDTIWKLNIRRLNGRKKDDPKYFEIKGSEEGLYNIGAVQVDKPVVLCESELDAISGAQQCGDLAAFVATGSTGRARRIEWKTRLCLASCVLVAFDDDEEDNNGIRAGDNAAMYWLNALPHATQWLPWAHDLNDMLVEGKDIRAWLQLGIESAALAQLEDTPAPAQPIPSDEENVADDTPCSATGCTRTLADDTEVTFHFDEDGRAWCPLHYNEAKQDPPPQQTKQDDTTSQEAVTSIADRITHSLPGQWAVELVDDLKAYKQRVLDQYRAELAPLLYNRERTQAEYWSEVRDVLARPDKQTGENYYEQLERERIERQMRIDAYKQWRSGPFVDMARLKAMGSDGKYRVHGAGNYTPGEPPTSFPVPQNASLQDCLMIRAAERVYPAIVDDLGETVVGEEGYRSVRQRYEAFKELKTWQEMLDAGYFSSDKRYSHGRLISLLARLQSLPPIEMLLAGVEVAK